MARVPQSTLPTVGGGDHQRMSRAREEVHTEPPSHTNFRKQATPEVVYSRIFRSAFRHAESYSTHETSFWEVEQSKDNAISHLGGQA